MQKNLIYLTLLAFSINSYAVTPAEEQLRQAVAEMKSALNPPAPEVLTTPAISQANAIIEQVKVIQSDVEEKRITIIPEDGKPALPTEREIEKVKEAVELKTANKPKQKVVIEGNEIGDVTSTKKVKSINGSSYTKDHDIYYDIFEQYEALQKFVDHPKVSKQGNQYVKNTLKHLENFINYINSGDGRFIIVNIPSYNLVAYNDLAIPVLESRIVVGAKNKQTPFENISITSLKYNPNWTPTNNMLKKYLVKNGEINVNYLASHGLKAYKNGKEVPYNEMVVGENYHIQQPSGVDNALGVLKFETNSKSNIYLHDTNQPHLYNNKNRAYSSGCIRVQNYQDLASWLARSENSDIVNNINKKKMYYQRVEKTPVYFTYFQALVNRNGKLITFNNVYNFSNEEIQSMYSEYATDEQEEDFH